MVGFNAAKWHKPSFEKWNFRSDILFRFRTSAPPKARRKSRERVVYQVGGRRCVGKSREKFDKRKEIWRKKVFSSFSTHTQAKRGFDFAGWCVLYGFQLRLCVCSKGINLPTFISRAAAVAREASPRVTNHLPNSTRRYQKELPKKIKQRGRDAHLIHEELVQCMKWKQSVSKAQIWLLASSLTICVLLAWQVLPATVISDQSEHTARSGDGNKEGIP